MSVGHHPRTRNHHRRHVRASVTARGWGWPTDVKWCALDMTTHCANKPTAVVAACRRPTWAQASCDFSMEEVELTCPSSNWGAVDRWWLREEGELFSLRICFLKFLYLYSLLHPMTENQFDFHCAYECNTLCQGLFLAPTCVCPSLLTFLCPAGILAG